MKIGFKRIVEDAVLPERKHDSDAGMDIRSAEDVVLVHGKPTVVHTGIKADIPNGFEVQVRPRSGLATKGVTVFNSPGTIDSGYTGEIGVVLIYFAQNGSESFKIEKGDRIAQLVVSPVTPCEALEVSEIGWSERGEEGFGSTGR